MGKKDRLAKMDSVAPDPMLVAASAIARAISPPQNGLQMASSAVGYLRQLVETAAQAKLLGWHEVETYCYDRAKEITSTELTEVAAGKPIE